MSAPSIVILSHIDASRSSSARARRVSALVNAFGRDVLLFQPGGRFPGCETRNLAWDLGRPPFPRRWARHNFRVPRNRRMVRDLLAVIRPGLVLLTSIHDFPAVEHLRDVPMALDARRVEAQVEDPAGRRPGPRSRLEKRVLARMDHVFACTEEDRLAFQERHGVPADRITVVPDGVDTTELTESGSATGLSRKWTRRFKGRTLLWYRADDDDAGAGESLVFLNRVLLPELERRLPGRFGLVVEGRKPSGFKPRPDLWFCPRESDAAPLFTRADACLAPALHHGIDRVAALELLAAGKPLVATPRAVRDIACANGVHAAVEEADAFADAVIRLAEDPATAAAMARSGRDFVRAMYDWRSVQSRWQVAVNRLIQDGSPA